MADRIPFPCPLLGSDGFFEQPAESHRPMSAIQEREWLDNDSRNARAYRAWQAQQSAEWLAHLDRLRERIESGEGVGDGMDRGEILGVREGAALIDQ